MGTDLHHPRGRTLLVNDTNRVPVCLKHVLHSSESPDCDVEEVVLTEKREQEMSLVKQEELPVPLDTGMFKIQMK